MMEATPLFLSILFGAIGTGMFIYGKRASRVAFILAGVALMVFPYFIPSAVAMGIAGSLISAAPFFVAW